MHGKRRLLSSARFVENSAAILGETVAEDFLLRVAKNYLVLSDRFTVMRLGRRNIHAPWFLPTKMTCALFDRAAHGVDVQPHAMFMLVA